MEETYCQKVILLPSPKFAIKFKGKLYNCIWSGLYLITLFKKPDRWLRCKYPEMCTLTSVCTMRYSWFVIARAVSFLATGSASQYGFSLLLRTYIVAALHTGDILLRVAEHGPVNPQTRHFNFSLYVSDRGGGLSCFLFSVDLLAHAGHHCAVALHCKSHRPNWTLCFRVFGYFKRIEER